MRIHLKNGHILKGKEVIGYYSRVSFGSFAFGYMVEWDDGTTALADTEDFILTLARQHLS